MPEHMRLGDILAGRKKIQWIKRDIIIPDFKVKVVSRGVTRTAHKTDYLSFPHIVTIFNQNDRIMRIAGKKVIPVLNIYCSAMTFGITGIYYFTIHGCNNY